VDAKTKKMRFRFDTERIPVHGFEYDFSNDELRDSVGNQAPKIGCLNGADNWGMPRRHNPLAKKGLGKHQCRFWYLCWNLTSWSSGCRRSESTATGFLEPAK
jgi:hypothetical protein